MNFFPPEVKENEELCTKVKIVIGEFLEKQITYEKAAEEIFNLVGTTDPIESLNKILQTDSTPLPYPESYKKTGLKRHKTRSWEAYEDQRLIAGIYKCGIENWTSISKFVGNGRTRSQCSQRWYRCLNPSISKSQWTKEEEEKLIDLVKKSSGKSWNKIAFKLGNRSDVQCRYKYKQLLRDDKSKKIQFKQGNGEDISKEIIMKNEDLIRLPHNMPTPMGFPIVFICNAYQPQTPGQFIGYQPNNQPGAEYPYYQPMYIMNQMPNVPQQYPIMYPNNIQPSKAINHSENQKESVNKINNQNDAASTSVECPAFEEEEQKIPENDLQASSVKDKIHVLSPNQIPINEIRITQNQPNLRVDTLNSPTFKGSLYSVY